MPAWVPDCPPTPAIPASRLDAARALRGQPALPHPSPTWASTGSPPRPGVSQPQCSIRLWGRTSSLNPAPILQTQVTLVLPLPKLAFARPLGLTSKGPGARPQYSQRPRGGQWLRFWPNPEVHLGPASPDYNSQKPRRRLGGVPACLGRWAPGLFRIETGLAF